MQKEEGQNEADAGNLLDEKFEIRLGGKAASDGTQMIEVRRPCHP